MYKEHTTTIGQKSMLQRSSSIKIIEEEEPNSVIKSSWIRKEQSHNNQKQKLILNRSNVAQFNKLNLSLITVVYCSPYTPQYQQKMPYSLLYGQMNLQNMGTHLTTDTVSHPRGL